MIWIVRRKCVEWQGGKCFDSHVYLNHMYEIYRCRLFYEKMQFHCKHSTYISYQKQVQTITFYSYELIDAMKHLQQIMLPLQTTKYSDIFHKIIYPIYVISFKKKLTIDESKKGSFHHAQTFRKSSDCIFFIWVSNTRIMNNKPVFIYFFFVSSFFVFLKL